MEGENEKNLLCMDGLISSKIENKTFANRTNIKKRFYKLKLNYAAFEKISLIQNINQYKLLIDDDFPIIFLKNGSKIKNKFVKNNNVILSSSNKSSNFSYFDHLGSNKKDEFFDKNCIYLNLKENFIENNYQIKESKQIIENRQRLNSLKELLNIKLNGLEEILNNKVNTN